MLSSVLNKEMSIFPDIFIEKTNKFFDNNNYDSLNCCVFNGFICTIDGIISGIKNTFPKNTFDVIITGRNIDIVANYSKEITNVDENLLIKGIILLTKNKLVVF